MIIIVWINDSVTIIMPDYACMHAYNDLYLSLMKKEIELSFFKLFHLITEFSTLKSFAINHLNSVKFPLFI